MFVSTALLTLLCLSCADRDPLGPEGSDALFQVNAAAHEEGCARFRVELSGQDGVEVKVVGPQTCGTLVPVIAGAPTFDRTKRLLRLPIALENHAQRKVKAPAWLLGWEDSLAVVSPAGLAANRHAQRYLSLESADSVAPAEDTGLHGARIWKYDEILAGSAEVQTLGPGKRSRVRWINVSVHPGVESFTMLLHGRADQAGLPVPPVPPRGFTIPVEQVQALYATDNLILEHPRMSGAYPRNVLMVAFRPTATQQERQAAIDLVGGEVIGGGWAVYYYLLVPTDGTGDPLWHAIDRLRALPQVQDAGPDVMINLVPTYQRPNDGAGWKTRDWQLSVDSARGENWGPEAVAAPLAWGCQTGNASAHVAAVDVAPIHSQWVASILHSSANDSAGMTGIMWNGTLSVTDASRGSSSPFAPAVSQQLALDLESAISGGAHVINLSIGAAYFDTTTAGGQAVIGQRLPKNNSQDLAAAQRYATILGSALLSWELKWSHEPFYVVAAGNYQTDARFSGFPILAADAALGPRIVVVAASDSVSSGPKSRALWANSGDPLDRGSSFGPLVSIAAPGANVVGFANGSRSVLSGTSFAAPHVAGVAGLLKSFDPRLSADSLKILILRGAAVGQHTSGGYPFLNAYESLKLAAQRPGAPLCGNRMWASNGEVVAQRGTGTETLFRVNEPVWEVNALHGGRNIRIMHPRSYRSFRYAAGPSGGTWREVPDTNTVDWPAGTSGAAHSFSSYSHDGDLRVRERTSSTGENLVVRLGLVDTRTRAETPLATINLPRQAPPRTGFCMLEFLDLPPEGLPSEWEPEYEEWRKWLKEGLYRLRKDSTCHVFSSHAPVVRGAMVGLGNGAYSPTGETYLYVANYQTHREQVLAKSCFSREMLFRPRDNGMDSIEVTVRYTCRDLRQQDEDSGAEVYTVPLPGGQGWKVRPELSEMAANLWNPRISEDGKEWSVTRVTTRKDYTDGFRWHPARREWENFRMVNSFERSCVTRFRSLETGAVREEVHACENLDDFTPTFSPSLFPGSRPGSAGTLPPAAVPPRRTAAPVRRPGSRT